MDGAAIAFLSWSLSVYEPKLATHDELPAWEEGKFVVGAHDFPEGDRNAYNTGWLALQEVLPPGCRIWSIPHPYKSPLFLRHHPASSLLG